MSQRPRPRRTTLAVPASNERMMDKARTLPSDAVFLDLEDAVAPIVKDAARAQAIDALKAGGYQQTCVSVRINAIGTQWCHTDLVSVVRGAPGAFQCIMLPKVRSAADIEWLDSQLATLEYELGLPRASIGIEAQIEDAIGLLNVESIAAASARLETLVFGPADFMASIGMRGNVVGQQPPGYSIGDAYHYPLMRMLVAGRAYGLQVIDGPYLAIRDFEGLRETAVRSAALGLDGKWVLHPEQIEIVNEVFSPAQDAFDHAELILDAYEHATSAAGGSRGAVMLGDEMIDEASRKMALVVSAAGRAAGMQRTSRFEP